MEQATFFSQIEGFVSDLVAFKVGEATVPKMQAIISDKEEREKLQLDLAIVLDSSIFCEKTYRFEGDRLESLIIFEDVEAILEKGRVIGDTMSTLPNVSAILRQRTRLQVGTPVYDWFGPPYSAFFKGKVTKLPRNLAEGEYTTKFEDGTTIEYSREELFNALDIRQEPEWEYAKDALKNSFDYLEKRLSDDPSVDDAYRLGSVYALFKTIRAFDPGFVAKGQLTPAYVDSMIDLPWLKHADITSLQAELADYMVAAKGSTLSFDHSNLNDFTNNVLDFWRGASCKLATWAKEARRAFCITPNSAASERVFSLLQNMFESNQVSSLSDYVEGGVMLQYNGRTLG